MSLSKSLNEALQGLPLDLTKLITCYARSRLFVFPSFSMSPFWSDLGEKNLVPHSLPSTPYAICSTQLGDGQLFAYNDISTVYRLDLVSLSWTAPIRLERVFYGRAFCMVENVLCFFGGWNRDFGYSKRCECYSLDTETWSTLLDLPVPLSDAAVAVHGGKIYVLGGLTSHGGISTVMILDWKTKKWSTGKSLLCPVSEAVATVHESSIYLITTKQLFRFDILLQSWKKLNNLPFSVSRPSLWISGEDLFVAETRADTNFLHIYRFADDRWAEAYPSFPKATNWSAHCAYVF